MVSPFASTIPALDVTENEGQGTGYRDDYVVGLALRRRPGREGMDSPSDCAKGVHRAGYLEEWVPVTLNFGVCVCAIGLAARIRRRG